MVGPSGLLIIIIGYSSFVMLVLVWGWEIIIIIIIIILFLGNIMFHCHILRALVELL